MALTFTISSHRRMYKLCMYKISEGVAVLFRLLIQDINGKGLRASDTFVCMINLKLLHFYHLMLNFVYSYDFCSQVVYVV